MSIDKEKINSKLKLYPTFFNYRNILIGGLGYDESTITEVCEDVYNFFKDKEEVEEFELDDFIVDRLKEDNLIGFTTDFVKLELIARDMLIDTTVKANPGCKVFKFIKE